MISAPMSRSFRQECWQAHESTSKAASPKDPPLRGEKALACSIAAREAIACCIC